MDGSHAEIFQYIILIILFSLSAFFSSSETALTSISKIKLRSMIDNNVKNAKIVGKLLNNKSKLLSAILIGNNLVNITATALSTYIATNLFGNAGVGIATGIITVVVLIFGEITPKSLAAANSEKIAVAVAKPVYFCMVIFTPVIFLLNIITSFILRFLTGDTLDNAPAVTETELLTMVNVSHEEGVIENDEKEMINNVVDLGDSDAKNIMIPRVDMVAIPINATLEQVGRVYKKEQFTRMPVYEDTTDNIIGILSIKDVGFLPDKEGFSVKKLMREPYFTYESKPCKDLLSIMRKNRIPMAIVLDEYGGTSGIVTLEDILEEIVGEIFDENDDSAEDIIKLSDNVFSVSGNARIDDVNHTIGSDFDDEDFDSIGGYISGIIGRFPISGEEIKLENYRFFIEETSKNRIERLKIIADKSKEEE